MGHLIKNTGLWPIYVRLHNGQSVRLSPGSSAEVDEVQVKANSGVEKLLKGGTIAIHSKAEAKLPAKKKAPAKKAKAPGTKNLRSGIRKKN